MRRLLLDVNVVLDVVLDRPPFAEAASALWAAAEKREIDIFVPAHGVTTVFYLAARLRDAAFARRALNELLIVPPDATGVAGTKAPETEGSPT